MTREYDLFARHLEARYRDDVLTFLGPDEIRRCEGRLRSMWRYLTRLLNHQGEAPWMQSVHSPLALPAFLTTGRHAPNLVWDAGLGTLFDRLSFPIIYDQPEQVVEALLRGVAAVRCIVTPESAQGSLQAKRARVLLKKTPIDRTHQKMMDATVDNESKMQVYLLTEMQERFILAHELAHYIKREEEAAFSRFSSKVLDQLDKSSYDLGGNSGRGILRDLKGHHLSGHHNELHRAGIDPWAWYIHDPEDSQFGKREWPSLVADVEVARNLIKNADEHQQEEMMCDLLGALATALMAHEKKSGWTAITGAANSRLALSNFYVIQAIDTWVKAAGTQKSISVSGLQDRQLFLNALLPLMLPQTIKEYDENFPLQPGDLHSVMHLVEDRFQQRIGNRLPSLGWIEGIEDPRPLNTDQVLIWSTFFNLRFDSF